MKQIEKKTFSQTDPVDGMNWFNSKLQSSISLLAISKFLQTDPVYELNRKSSKFYISNSLPKKFQSVQDLIQSINNFELFQHFEAPVACFSYWIFSKTDFVYETIWNV